LLNGEDISKLPPNKRPVNTVFQKYALFPHLNVYENIAFGLRLKKVENTYSNKNGESYKKLERLTKAEIDKKVKKALEIVDLEGFEKRAVSTLSGGQQQRVAIARALILQPEILCFDEPTSALDPELTGEVLRVIRSLKEETKMTMLIVTHEIMFAREVADKVIFLDKGAILEMGDAKEVIDSPKNERTREFMSNIMNK